MKIKGKAVQREGQYRQIALPNHIPSSTQLPPLRKWYHPPADCSSQKPWSHSFFSPGILTSPICCTSKTCPESFLLHFFYISIIQTIIIHLYYKPPYCSLHVYSYAVQCQIKNVDQIMSTFQSFC